MPGSARPYVISWPTVYLVPELAPVRDELARVTRDQLDDLVGFTVLVLSRR